ncbi:MAG: hypothetical protein ACLFNU_03165 [Bacteroidales bacterium]
MRKTIAIISLFIMLSSCKQTISDFQYDNFLKYFGSGSGSYGYDIAELTDGGYIITGTDNSSQLQTQALIVRTDKAGNSLWNRNYGSEHNEEGKVISMLEGDIVVAGNQTNYITGTSEAFLLRVSINGDSLSFHSYGGDMNVVLHHMGIHNSNIYIAGEIYESNPQTANYYIACINPQGEILWQRVYGNSNGRQAYKKIFFSDDGSISTIGINNALTGSEFSHISYTELNNLGIPTGGLHIPLDKSQDFGDAISTNNNFYILYSTLSEQSTNNHITKICDGSICWNIDLENTGRGTSFAMINDNTFLLSTTHNELATFNTIGFSQNGETLSVEELKSFPGEVYRTTSTEDGGIIAIGATSVAEGGMVRLIRTNAELYLLNP